MPPDSDRDPRARVLALVKRHGDEATAFQVLESSYRYFFASDEACIAYVEVGSAWVAAGSPIAPTSARAAAVSAFIAAARGQRKRVHFFATERPLPTLRALPIGEQPIWDPRSWQARLGQLRSLREQLRRARAKGVQVRLLSATELEAPEQRARLMRVAERWLDSRTMAPMGFLVRVELFRFASERRCFVAELAGTLVGFGAVVPVPGREGWFLEDLVRDPKAPNGTSELLVDAVMRWAASEGCGWLTLGLAPLAGNVPGPLAKIRELSAPLYDFPGLRKYKAKLRPDSWQPIYLCTAANESAFFALYDSLHAFADGSFARFALRTVLRGPKIMARVLAALLLPWTALLIGAPSARWFGAPWVKWAWVTFDVALAFGLFRLLRKPVPALLRLLAVAVTSDALLTTSQVLFWNLHHVHSHWDYLVLGVACLGPCLSAMVLWGASRHRLRFI